MRDFKPCLVEPAYDMLCVLPLRHSIPVASNLSLNKWLTPSASRETFRRLMCVSREWRQRTNPWVRPIHLSTRSSLAWHSVQSFFIHLEWKQVAKCENYKGRRNRANLFPLFRERDDPGKRDFRTKAGIVSKFAFQLETHVHVINISRKNVRQRGSSGTRDEFQCELLLCNSIQFL